MRRLFRILTVVVFWSMGLFACTPSNSPTYETLGGDSVAGRREIIAISFSGSASGCRLQVSNVDASVVGTATATQLVTFGAWKTTDSTCAYANLQTTPYLVGLLATNQYKESDRFVTAAGTIIIPAPDVGEVICLGFDKTYSDWYQGFNFTFSYIN